jgi:hypothetical protein
MVDWQMDAKFYEFWTRGSTDGRFTIPKVRPGTNPLTLTIPPGGATSGVIYDYLRLEAKRQPATTPHRLLRPVLRKIAI